MKTYSKMMMSDKTAMRYFSEIPASTHFKLYIKDAVPSGMFITHFVDEEDLVDTSFDPTAVIQALEEFMPNANNLDSEGIEYSFDTPKKLYFYIKDVGTPFKIYIDAE